MKKINKKLTVLLFLLVGACNLDGDLQNPNEVSLAGADVNLLMNAVQLDFGDWFYTASGTVDPLVRMTAMTGGYRYQTANQPQNNDGLWIQSYQNVLVNAEALIPLAAAKGLTTHIAVAKILQAYVYVGLVDIFGDIPQSEALKGPSGVFNPKQDGGASVYAYALTLLDDARTQLALTGSAAGGPLTRDVYYGGNRAKWTALANTLELKMQMNLAQDPANAAAANARIAVLFNGTTNIIDASDLSEDFTYKYGTATVPNSRHPLYNAHYTPTRGAAGGYLSNYYMHELFGFWNPLDSKNPKSTALVQDPRWRYYFYRQVPSVSAIAKVDPKAVGCTPGTDPNHYLAAGTVFCVFDPGFYGRDHGDASGTPPSGPVQTVAGIYPAGGLLDDEPVSVTQAPNLDPKDPAYFVGAHPVLRGEGENGKGILPIWMSFMTEYMRAEYNLRVGNTATAQTNLATAITRSVTTVVTFATNGVGQVFTNSSRPPRAAYQAKVDAAWSAATTTNDKMGVLGMEFYKALWGNGLEMYNLYRRTSAPRNFQPTLQINPGPWLRTQVYPSVYVNLNQNAAQKDANATVKTFWDKNPDVLN